MSAQSTPTQQPQASGHAEPAPAAVGSDVPATASASSFDPAAGGDTEGKGQPAPAHLSYAVELWDQPEAALAAFTKRLQSIDVVVSRCT